MNDTTISTERLKDLEGMEEVYQSLHLDYITLKAENRTLKGHISEYKTALNLANNELKKLLDT
jgi:hypothetical protein